MTLLNLLTYHSSAIASWEAAKNVARPPVLGTGCLKCAKSQCQNWYFFMWSGSPIRQVNRSSHYLPRPVAGLLWIPRPPHRPRVCPAAPSPVLTKQACLDICAKLEQNLLGKGLQIWCRLSILPALRVAVVVGTAWSTHLHLGDSHWHWWFPTQKTRKHDWCLVNFKGKNMAHMAQNFFPSTFGWWSIFASICSHPCQVVGSSLLIFTCASCYKPPSVVRCDTVFLEKPMQQLCLTLCRPHH